MKTLIVVALAVLLVGCGGGGVSVSSVAPAVIANKQKSVSSYINTKELSTWSADFPNINGPGIPEFNSLAYSFFNYANGSEGVFVNVVVYDDVTQTPDTATPARMTFWVRDHGKWVVKDIIDNTSVPNCIHPRKSLPADYNNDGVMDFVLICHGWDTAPLFPGERNRVILSQPNGKYKVEYFNNDVGFWHGGASQDFNDDGYPDVALTNSQSINVYINDGQGRFTKKSTDYTIVLNNRHHYSLELVDVNKDGKFDVIIGGHEFDGMPTTILYNRGDNRFARAIVHVIPSITGAGVVLDFTYSPATNSIFVVRTGDGWGPESISCNRVWTDDGIIWKSPADCSHASFYKGVLIQQYSVINKTSSIVYSQPAFHQLAKFDWVDARNNWPWMPWSRIHNNKLNSDWGTAFSSMINI